MGYALQVESYTPFLQWRRMVWESEAVGDRKNVQQRDIDIIADCLGKEFSMDDLSQKVKIRREKDEINIENHWLALSQSLSNILNSLWLNFYLLNPSYKSLRDNSMKKVFCTEYMLSFKDAIIFLLSTSYSTHCKTNQRHHAWVSFMFNNNKTSMVMFSNLKDCEVVILGLMYQHHHFNI